MASEPLLGSAWLLSQSPSSSSSSSSGNTSGESPSTSTHTRITPAVCENYSLFKRLLDQSRRASDDAISTRLNRAGALAGTAVSGRGSAREMGDRECDSVWRDIVARWNERAQALEFCDRALGHTARTGEVAGATAGAAATPRDRNAGDELASVRGLSADWKEQGRGVMDEAELKVRMEPFPRSALVARRVPLEAGSREERLARADAFVYLAVAVPSRPSTSMPTRNHACRPLSDLACKPSSPSSKSSARGPSPSLRRGVRLTRDPIRPSRRCRCSAGPSRTRRGGDGGGGTSAGASGGTRCWARVCGRSLPGYRDDCIRSGPSC